jgi:hypothetical protein
MQNKALVVGIDAYAQAPLYGCCNDASSVGALLGRNEDGSPNFTVREEFNVTTQRDLRKMVRELFAGAADMALFYFSGHGYLGEEGGYLVLPDFDDGNEGLRTKELLEIANGSPASNRIIILDCCHAGDIASGNQEQSGPPPIKRGTTILAACSEREVSLESDGHGVFTSLLIEGLKGGAAGITGAVTPGSIYAYIDRSLDAWEQRPIFATNVRNFIPVRSCRPPVAHDILRKIPQYFISPDHEFRLDPSYEDTNSPIIQHEIVQPYAVVDNVAIFKELQELHKVGIVTPVGEQYMYFAAMHSKSCKLTPLGRHFWEVAKKGLI